MRKASRRRAGAVSGVASALPELHGGLGSSALLAGDQEHMPALEARVMEFLDWSDLFPLPVGCKGGAETT